jgi:hypothetical protein
VPEKIEDSLLGALDYRYGTFQFAIANTIIKLAQLALEKKRKS